MRDYVAFGNVEQTLVDPTVQAELHAGVAKVINSWTVLLEQVSSIEPLLELFAHQQHILQQVQ